jgi:hypothetical protein
MTSIDPALMQKVQRTRDGLVNQLQSRPEVSLIDIGRAPDSSPDAGLLAIRVHVRQPATFESLGIPSEVDGIPVRILMGGYQLE